MDPRIEAWLRRAGFGHCVPLLADLDGPGLAAAGNDDLRARGIASWGVRTKLRRAVAAAKPTLSSLGAGAAAGRSAASLSSAHASRSAYCRPSSASTALVHIDRNFASHGRSLRRERGGAQAAM